MAGSGASDREKSGQWEAEGRVEWGVRALSWGPGEVGGLREHRRYPQTSSPVPSQPCDSRDTEAGLSGVGTHRHHPRAPD
jgi:hypothetical protein